MGRPEASPENHETPKTEIIPAVVRLLRNGRLTPLVRAYGKHESAPDITVIAAYDASPNNKKVVHELKIVSFPLSELELAREWIKEQKTIEDTAIQAFERFMRGVNTSLTSRHLMDSGPNDLFEGQDGMDFLPRR